jgi:F-type H+-transporting ATPase subunit alpha
MEKRSVLEFANIIKQNIENFNVNYQLDEFGTVVSICDGVAKIYGLENVAIGELVQFENEVRGIALNLNQHSVDVVIFDADSALSEGMKAFRTNNVVSVPVGMQMLGRVVDALGNAIDGKGEIKTSLKNPVEKMAPPILDRKSVHEPLQTGVKAVDSLIPIGRGQRELIIGDRQTGKTAIALDAILNQAKINKTKSSDKEKVFCIYVAIGQKKSTVAKIVRQLEQEGAMESTVVVVASASDPVSLQFLAPYSGCAIGEYFRDNGMHALIIYDDLSKHAVAYRQMSLLLRRPPSREAYPGDVFYLHSRLLERAAKLSDAKGAGSLTALPIIETQAGDISAYIPTNVISITDGQIFLESDLFYQGFRPAINIGLSVSRVGSAAQKKAMKQVSGSLKSDLAQYRELEAFSKFGSDLDASTIAVLDRGRKVSQILIQRDGHPLSLAEEVVVLFTIANNMLVTIPVDKIRQFETELLALFNTHHKNILEQIESEGMINDDLKLSIKNIIVDFINSFIV